MTVREDNIWANNEIERWEMKKLGVNPVKHYVAKVVSIILNNIPDDVAQYTGVDYHIVEDIITQEPEKSDDKNVYDLYKEYIEVNRAAEILGKVLEEYMLGG